MCDNQVLGTKSHGAEHGDRNLTHLSLHFTGEGKGSSERLNSFPEVTKLVSNNPKMQTQTTVTKLFLLHRKWYHCE